MSIGPTASISHGPRTKKFTRNISAERVTKHQKRNVLASFIARIFRSKRKTKQSRLESENEQVPAIPPPSLNELARREESLVLEMMLRRPSPTPLPTGPLVVPSGYYSPLPPPILETLTVEGYSLPPTVPVPCVAQCEIRPPMPVPRSSLQCDKNDDAYEPLTFCSSRPVR